MPKYISVIDGLYNPPPPVKALTEDSLEHVDVLIQ